MFTAHSTVSLLATLSGRIRWARFTLQDRPGAYLSGSTRPLLLGIFGLFSLLAYDKLYWRAAIFTEGWPEFSYGRLLRSAVIAVCVAALCWGGIRIGGCSKSSWACEAGSDPWSQRERWTAFGAILTSVFFLGVFIVAPSLFSVLSIEDGPVESASAILLFAASVIFGVAFFQSAKVRVAPGILRTFVLFAGVFFILGMEEVSWFQRVVQVGTPEAFRNNSQHEINLHNFAADPAENAYYFGAFIFLVVLPFIRLRAFRRIRSAYLDLFMPRPVVLVVGALACAYNFDMWNILFIQVSFFGAVMVLLAYGAYHAGSVERLITFCTFALVTVTQIMFLTHGQNFARLWEVTEYKEFFIPLGFLCYAIDVYRRNKNSIQSSSTREA